MDERTCAAAKDRGADLANRSGSIRAFDRGVRRHPTTFAGGLILHIDAQFVACRTQLEALRCATEPYRTVGRFTVRFAGCTRGQVECTPSFAFARHQLLLRHRPSTLAVVELDRCDPQGQRRVALDLQRDASGHGDDHDHDESQTYDGSSTISRCETQQTWLPIPVTH